jgi:hypothetical protein
VSEAGPAGLGWQLHSCWLSWLLHPCAVKQVTNSHCQRLLHGAACSAELAMHACMCEQPVVPVAVHASFREALAHRKHSASTAQAQRKHSASTRYTRQALLGLSILSMPHWHTRCVQARSHWAPTIGPVRGNSGNACRLPWLGPWSSVGVVKCCCQTYLNHQHVMRLATVTHHLRM